MMRSLYSGVAGLKTHQVKMDVIGNNIANVNTTAYKAQTITFNELMYQTTKRASGASADTGVGGTNAGQIGLGVKVGAINTNISSQGAMQTTNLPFDLAITGDAFFIVSNGLENFFTRAGSFYVDGAGNLAMTSTGFNVMGWTVDPDNPNNIKKDTVTALKVMTEANMTYEAEATTKATVAGIIDRNDTDINSSSGRIMNLEFFDDQGFKYTARFATHVIDADNGEYYTRLVDVLDSNGRSMRVHDKEKFEMISFGGTEYVRANDNVLAKSSTNVKQTIELGQNAVEQTVTHPFGFSGTGTKFIYEVGAATAPAGAAGTPMDKAEIIKLYGERAEAELDRADANSVTATYIIGRNGAIIINVPAYGNVSAKTTTIQLGEKGATEAKAGEFAITEITLTNGGTTLEIDTLPAFFEIDRISRQFIQPGVSPPTALTATQFPTGISNTAEMWDLIDKLYPGYPERMEGVMAFRINNDGSITITQKEVKNAAIMNYNVGNGKFMDISGNTQGLISLEFKQGDSPDMSNFKNVEINFLNTLTNNNNGRSTISAAAGGTGDEKGLGTGRRSGEMIEIVVQDDGRIYANYDNGMSRLLAQIAVATFANPSGLEKKGDNLYAATMNSGSFDGIGDDIKNGGGYMSSGVLEMSNVDLSSEFTEMITTQRGFQANSRIITVSDSLLEELTNLKR